MPDNTRPRIVNTDTFTPAFNPNAPDPRQLIADIMQPAYQPPAPKPGILDTIINSLAQGVAIGTSQSPGDALRQTLATKAQQQFEAEQARNDYNRRLDLMSRQFGLQETANQLEEQRRVNAEVREDRRYQSRRKDSMDDYIQKNGIDVQADEAKDKRQFEYRKAAAILEHQWDLEKQSKADARFDRQQTRLENKDLFDKKIALITAGIPAGMANKIASKMYNGEDLTKEESSVITAAARRQLRPASGTRRSSGGGSSSSGLTAKQMFQYMNVRMKDQFVVVKDADGNDKVVEMSNAPKNSITGEIEGFVRIATGAEKRAQIGEEINEMESLLSPQEQAKANGQSLPENNPYAKYYDPKIHNGTLKDTGESFNVPIPADMLASPAIPDAQKAALFYRNEFERLKKEGASAALAEKLIRDKIAKDAPQDSQVLDVLFPPKLKGGKTMKQIKAETRRQYQ